MLKLKNHLYQSLESSKVDLENPDETAIIEIGGGYKAPLGDIYRAISAIEYLEDNHLAVSFAEEETEDIEQYIIGIQEKLELIIGTLSTKIDEENPLTKLHRAIARLYPIEW